MPMSYPFKSRQDAYEVNAVCEAVNELLSLISVRDLAGLKDEHRKLVLDVHELRRVTDLDRNLMTNEIERQVKGLCGVLEKNMEEIRSAITPEKILASLQPTLDQAILGLTEQVDNHIQAHLTESTIFGRHCANDDNMNSEALATTNEQTEKQEDTDILNVQQFETFKSQFEFVTKQHNSAIVNLEVKIAEFEIMAQTISDKCDDAMKTWTIASNAVALQGRTSNDVLVSSQPQFSCRSTMSGNMKNGTLTDASTRESTASSLPSVSARVGSEIGVTHEAGKQLPANNDSGAGSGALDILSQCVPMDKFSESEWRLPLRRCI
eukprot:TRINITY_DN23914_c0_g1_i1.p1 TRINITY_DN23914_c0_g1~~TRINITY_DN23914_c0_g1_i1.p1  ORF type:complete len:322 (+),score=32.61 TRINITY_DN23914_c0_g1_i1:78-1043(+)